MKKCSTCKVEKELSCFGKRKSNKDGIRYQCKECESRAGLITKRSKMGLATVMYSSQRLRSRKHKHKIIGYTKKEFSDWLLNSPLFDSLYIEWVESGYTKELKPSVDRINNSKGYCFDNIQIMTWQDNIKKANNDIRSGKLTHGNKPQRCVVRLSLDGVYIDEFISLNEAFRITGISHGNISMCCNNKRPYASGFKWMFKEDYLNEQGL